MSEGFTSVKFDGIGTFRAFRRGDEFFIEVIKNTPGVLTYPDVRSGMLLMDLTTNQRRRIEEFRIGRTGLRFRATLQE